MVITVCEVDVHETKTNWNGLMTVANFGYTHQGFLQLLLL